ncbi:Metallo-dependent phosphatase-like protein [Globomyces pollinis-pini]|nr:Metallo-dependent phosphatase-like protein [Globomyces pollinis-pini]
MRIAIQGCCHGELDTIYNKLLQTHSSTKIDLLLICGDFQAIRNKFDLKSMSVPDKFKKLGNFYEYYTGIKKAPILTVFIGGNHEASNYLFELFYGGWVCPNIYYLGSAGVINIGGLRIAGISGIYNQFNYHKGFYETQPFRGGDVKSVYHTRKFNVDKLSLIKNPVDIFLSHDWPIGITDHGDVKTLLKKKSFFRKEVEERRLGSPPLEYLLNHIQPKYWFSAHLHVRFSATVVHDSIQNGPKIQTQKSNDIGEFNPDQIDIDVSDDEIDSTANPDQIQIEVSDDDENDTATKKLNDDKDEIPAQSGSKNSVKKQRLANRTEFLALDKCGKHREFLEIVDVPHDANIPIEVQLDREWLSIIKSTYPYISFQKSQKHIPKDIDNALSANLAWIENHLAELRPPEFIETSTAYNENLSDSIDGTIYYFR